MGDALEFKTKVCLLGESQVGKTSLIRKFVMDRFSDEYITTLGTKVTKKEVLVTKGDKKYNLTMMIWDVEGRRDNLSKNIDDFTASVPPGYIPGSEGIFLVFDLTRKETLESIKHWYEGVVKSVGKQIPCILLGNKNDLEIVVKDEDILAHTRDYGFQVYLTSAKTGENIEQAFEDLADKVLTGLGK